MIVCEEARANEHEEGPYRNAHEHADEGGFLRLAVAFCREVSLHNRLVGAVFLQGVEDAVEHHDEEGELGEVPIVWSETNFVVLGGYAHHLRRPSLGQEEQQRCTDETAADEERSLHDIHPHDGLHASEEREDDDGDSEDKDDGVDVDVEEGGESHGHEEEDGARLGEMPEGESQGTVKTCEQSKASLEILVGGESYDFSEKRHDDPDECEQHDGNHQSLDEEDPVVGVCRARVGEEGDA